MQKKFSTNIYEATQVNDLILTSSKFTNKLGLNNRLKSIIKNVNSDANNSSKLKEKKQSELLTLISYDLDIPLIKEDGDYMNLLIPKLSLRFSPNDSKNLKDENRLLTSDNIFSLNRIGFNETIEGGGSLTLGLDYEKKNQRNGHLFDAKVATVFRDELNENLPNSSTLGKKQSDFVGEIRYIPNSNFSFDYNFSANNNFDQINFHSFENSFKVNNFITSFNFLEKTGNFGNVNTLENTSEIRFDDQNSLLFKTRRNRKISLTEYYDLVYEYQNDCLTAGIKYRKTYYQIYVKSATYS